MPGPFIWVWYFHQDSHVKLVRRVVFTKPNKMKKPRKEKEENGLEIVRVILVIYDALSEFCFLFSFLWPCSRVWYLLCLQCFTIFPYATTFFFYQCCSSILLDDKERRVFLKKMRNPRTEPLMKSELQKKVVKKCTSMTSGQKSVTCSKCGYMNGLIFFFIFIFLAKASPLF